MADLLARLDPLVYVLTRFPTWLRTPSRTSRQHAPCPARGPALDAHRPGGARQAVASGHRARVGVVQPSAREPWWKPATRGFTGLHVVPAASLIGVDNEATVDGIHRRTWGSRGSPRGSPRCSRPWFGANPGVVLAAWTIMSRSSSGTSRRSIQCFHLEDPSGEDRRHETLGERCAHCHRHTVHVPDAGVAEPQPVLVHRPRRTHHHHLEERREARLVVEHIGAVLPERHLPPTEGGRSAS